MQVLYGTPLPPGLVAPTQGELRLRVEQLVLENDAINHNPLVQLFDVDSSTLAPSRAHHSSAAAGNAEVPSTVAARSPNRFVVPVDYCAVGPIFWGETRPTAQGQPSTPHVRRGPLTMAYPIKIEPRQFHAYLQRMTASPQGGVQLDVFVPSSYSGRPPVTVGKARLALDHVAPGRPVHGWFPVLHRRCGMAMAPSTAGAAGDDAAHASGTAQLKEVPIGKVKVSVTIEYYPTARQAPVLDGRRDETQQQQQQRQKSAKHRRHTEPLSESGARALPQAKTRRSARHAGRAAAHGAALPPYSLSSSSSSASSSDQYLDVNVDLTQLRGSRERQALSQSSAALAPDLPAATRQLLQQGLRLRAQMEAAARNVDVNAAMAMPATRPGLDEDDSAVAPDAPRTYYPAVEGADVSHEDDDSAAKDVDVDDASDYTSEASDEEKFALQLQRDSEARDNRTTQQATVSSPVPHEFSTTQREQKHSLSHDVQQRSRVETKGIASAMTSLVAGTVAPAAVELCFSHFSFAQTPATADLQQLRLNVRLSSDVTTTEPTPGPLSSYVHPVPFQQPSICLHFDVCSYSEDRSKLVVEAYKVVAESEVEGDADAWDVRGPRHVAREELLGLSVVGLYRQSREVVFRDPVLDSSNVYAHLEVRMQPTGTAEAPDTFMMVTDKEKKAKLPADEVPSRSATPVSDAVPFSSIAASSAAAAAAAVTAPAVQRTEQFLPPPSVSVSKQNEVSSAHTAGTAAATQTALSPSLLHPCDATTELRRLRVVVHSAAELPRVALCTTEAGRTAARCPLVLSSPRVLSDAGVDGAQSYTEPSTFVTVEELYQSSSSACGGVDRQAEDSAAKSRAQMRAVAEWHVEEARGGYYDRSAVAAQSSNPYYDYEVILQLPEAPPQPSVNESGRPNQSLRTASVNATTLTRGVTDVLEELQLNVWHSVYTPHSPSSATESGQRRAPLPQQQEEEFWACAAYMGTCRVDLRPLRYLAMINGYYRVVCERTPNNATDQTQTDVEANTIGYVRVSVSLA